MGSTVGFWPAAVAAVLALAAVAGAGGSEARAKDWVIRNGKLYVDGRWVFLKMGKPLRDFGNARQCEELIRDLELLQKKDYNGLELNCYWHQLDKDGDGQPDVPLEPLRKLIEAIRERGMFPCLSVETYGVGGGQIPAGFWKAHPDAVAINAAGRPIQDTEYGFNSMVPTHFSPEYRAAVHAYIRNLTKALPHESILYYETTVEPQYTGNEALDYSPHARKAYEAWLARTGTQGPAWPEKLPAPEAFRNDPVWNRFRAEALADWVNQDAAAYREAAGKDAYIAVDYLETCGGEMRNRNGGSRAFLKALTCANIIQVNWHWHLGTRKGNDGAYANVRAVMRETGRDWAVSEHMTLNGSDYRPAEVAGMLRNTMRQGTRFGWEFVNVSAGSKDPFALYQNDWSPKPLMAEVEKNWAQWMEEVRKAEEGAGREK